MAISPSCPSEQIEAHLADCADCRREVAAASGALSSLLDTQERQQRTENVWKRIEHRLPDASSCPEHFSVLGIHLCFSVCYCSATDSSRCIPDRDFGFLFKLVPVLFVIAAFSYLRENPFKINSELRLEGE